MKKFREFIKDIIESDHIPDYQVYFDDDKKDLLIVRPRVAPHPAINQSKLFLKSQTYENVEKVLSPKGLDKYAIEAEWLEYWKDSGCPELKNPDGAFYKFCERKAKNAR